MSESPHKEFLDLYRPIHGQFAKFCGSHAYGIMETQDLVQESILQTMQHFGRLRDKEKLLYFMVGVANNISKNALRRKKFSARIDDARLRQLEGMISDPAMALDIQYLYRAMNRLPLKMKEAVILFEINGMSMKEIAEVQQTSESAVKTCVSRGREKLRAMLSENRVSYDVGGGKTLFTFIL